MIEDTVLILVNMSRHLWSLKAFNTIESHLNQVYQSGVLAVLCGLFRWNASHWGVSVVGGV